MHSSLSPPPTPYRCGILHIDGLQYQDPSGCFPIDSSPLVVANNADSVAEVHSGPDCSGAVEWLVYPGETYQTQTAKSVFIGRPVRGGPSP